MALGAERERLEQGKDLLGDAGPTPKTPPPWRLLSTVSDIVALIADRLRPLHDRLHKARWILWRQIHRARAQISHYHRRDERPPIHLRE